MNLRIILAVMLLLCTAYRANSQNNVKFRSRYVINTPVVYTSFVDNSANISDMRTFLEMVRDGQWMFSNIKTCIGFDRGVDISSAYSFDMERFTHTYRMKGGRR